MKNAMRDHPARSPITSTVDEMRECEDDRLDSARQDPSSPYYAGPDRARTDRRRFMVGAIAAAGSAAGLSRAAFAEAPASAGERDVPADATKVQGYPLEDTSYGSRSQYETEVRQRFKTATPLSSWTLTPLEKGCGVITPSGLHFERSHGGTAVI
ncbi:MAG: sulfite dehydrogenase, partial [Burkholderiaceae bacterium]